jgi:hypothetical protein
MPVGLDPETVLDQGKMCVVFPEEAGEMSIVLERDDNPLAWSLGFGHSPRTCQRLAANS